MRKHLGKRPSASLVISCLALFIALGGTTYAATGGNFILGRANSAGAQTALSAPIANKALQVTNTSTAAGASGIGITVGTNKAPLAVNATAGKATNLNADKLDGKDSTAFANAAQEAWHEVGTPGEPRFNCLGGDSNCNDAWDHYGFGFNRVAFFKDSLGIVHLKGLARWVKPGTTVLPTCSHDITIFRLPVGYRPAAYEVLPALFTSRPSRLDVGPDGWIYLCTDENVSMDEWYALDGMTFRAAN
jgi:hypothetical protein